MEPQPTEWVEDLEHERREDPAKPLANLTPTEERDDVGVKT